MVGHEQTDGGRSQENQNKKKVEQQQNKNKELPISPIKNVYIKLCVCVYDWSFYWIKIEKKLEFQMTLKCFKNNCKNFFKNYLKDLTEIDDKKSTQLN